MEKALNAEQKEEFQVYFGIKSKLGIIWFMQCVAALLAVIGFLCPLFSYNQTKIDALKETVNLMDVPIAIVGLLFLVVPIILNVILVFQFQKAIVGGTQVKLGKKLVGITVGNGISILLSVIMVAVAYLLYDVSSSGYAYIELDFEAGFYLFIIGSICFFLLNLLFTAVARNVLNGKLNRDQLLFQKNNVSGTNVNREDRTMEDKLTELKRLRDVGVLSEEEFQSKKNELLKQL